MYSVTYKINLTNKKKPQKNKRQDKERTKPKKMGESIKIQNEWIMHISLLLQPERPKGSNIMVHISHGVGH